MNGNNTTLQYTLLAPFLNPAKSPILKKQKIQKKEKKTKALVAHYHPLLNVLSLFSLS